MARGGGITKANFLFLRGAKGAENGLRKFSGTAKPAAEIESSGGVSKSSGKIEDDTACWVPHPRTGIYFPKGQEWVMDDVSEGAARFSQTHWFRSVDGVDNPTPYLDAPQHSHTSRTQEKNP